MNFDNITLIVFEGNKTKHQQANFVFEQMSKVGQFDNCVFIKKDFTYKQAMEFELGGYLDYIDSNSSHCLVCTWDGFIVNPKLWNFNWLLFDMIGAPWPRSFNTNNRVGNTGFTLLSKKFLETAKKYKHRWNGEPGDVFLCQIMYETFKKAEGIKYAEIVEASAFSFEHYIEEGLTGPNTSFGFHGWVAGKTPELYYNVIKNF